MTDGGPPFAVSRIGPDARASGPYETLSVEMQPEPETSVEDGAQRRQAELLAAELARRAEAIGPRLMAAAIALAQLAPAAGRELLRQLDGLSDAHPELAEGLGRVRSAVAAELGPEQA